MPIKKFRSVEEMEGNTWREPGDPEIFRVLKALADFSAQTFPRHFPMM